MSLLRAPTTRRLVSALISPSSAPSARFTPSLVAVTTAATCFSRLAPHASSSSFHTSHRPCNAPPSSSSSSYSNDDSSLPKKTPIGRIQRRLQITFTCTAPVPSTTTVNEGSPETIETTTCSHRSTHEFSRHAYEKGIVLIECPGCKNRHLIADHLEWFSTTPSEAHPQGLPFNSNSGIKTSRTIEDLMREKGEKVQWLKGGEQGDTWTVEG